MTSTTSRYTMIVLYVDGQLSQEVPQLPPPIGDSGNQEDAMIAYLNRYCAGWIAAKCETRSLCEDRAALAAGIKLPTTGSGPGVTRSEVSRQEIDSAAAKACGGKLPEKYRQLGLRAVAEQHDRVQVPGRLFRVWTINHAPEGKMADGMVANGVRYWAETIEAVDVDDAKAALLRHLADDHSYSRSWLGDEVPPAVRLGIEPPDEVCLGYGLANPKARIVGPKLASLREAE